MQAGLSSKALETLDRSFSQDGGDMFRKAAPNLAVMGQLDYVLSRSSRVTDPGQRAMAVRNVADFLALSNHPGDALKAAMSLDNPESRSWVTDETLRQISRISGSAAALALLGAAGSRGAASLLIVWTRRNGRAESPKR